MTHSTKVTSKTFFIGTPGSWDAVSCSLKLLSCGRAKTVRFAGTVDELDDASETIGVVVLSVGGMADYALEICPNEKLDHSQVEYRIAEPRSG